MYLEAMFYMALIFSALLSFDYLLDDPTRMIYTYAGQKYHHRRISYSKCNRYVHVSTRYFSVI